MKRVVYSWIKSYRDSWNDGRLPLDQLEDLGLGLLCILVFVFLPGQLSKCNLELVVRDVAAGFLPTKRRWKRSLSEKKHLSRGRNAACRFAYQRLVSTASRSRLKARNVHRAMCNHFNGGKMEDMARRWYPAGINSKKPTLYLISPCLRA